MKIDQTTSLELLARMSGEDGKIRSRSFDLFAELAPAGWEDEFVEGLEQYAFELERAGSSHAQILEQVIFHATGERFKVPIFVDVTAATLSEMTAESVFRARRVATSSNRALKNAA